MHMMTYIKRMAKEKRSLLTLALVLALGVGSVGCQISLNSESVSDQVSEENLQTQTTVPKIELQESFKKDGEKYSLEFRIPVVTNSGNATAEKTINEVISADVEALRKEIVTSREEVEKDPTLKDQLDSPIFQYYAGSELLSEYASASYVSMAVGYSSYTGGAHGMYNVVPYNYRLSDGVALKLVDVIEGDEDDMKVINGIIKDKIKNDAIELYDDANPAITKDYEFFYITKDNLVVYYNTYAIAPYAAGVLTFEVPLKDLKVIIK